MIDQSVHAANLDTLERLIETALLDADSDGQALDRIGRLASKAAALTRRVMVQSTPVISLVASRARHR